MQKLLITMIKSYQYLLSPYLGTHCRYYPSCSHYALTAVKEHGTLKGLSLTIRRVSRCHPWHEGGYDPVPNNTNKKD
ncbi:MAG: membrane protein insertion efficiency factor YidD [Gammaproteobacteria bacterium]|nr:membrane protein insertion efficiency factor YidD [Gammaproteobacteria bacterium]